MTFLAPKHKFLLPKPIQIDLGSEKLCLGPNKRHFTTFYFFTLNFCVKIVSKLPKNGYFSIFDKSADSADINDRQNI